MSLKTGNIVKLLVLLFPALMLMSFVAINGKTVSNFSLKNTNGKTVSLADYKEAKGFIVVFTCNHCPFAKLYYKRFNELNNEFKPLGVPLLAISSTDTVSYEEDTYLNMQRLAKKEHFTFPYLYDDMQSVAHDFSAQKTPHAYVIWKENGQWVVKYNGAVDDNGVHAELVTKHYVADAVKELLAGKEVSVKESRSVGCQINFRKK